LGCESQGSQIVLSMEKRIKPINVRLTETEYLWLLTHSPNVSLGVRLLILDGMRREKK